MTGRIIINVTDVRSEPRFQSERISQALFNELAEIIDEDADYHKIRQWDGYEGWIGKQFLSSHGGFEGQGPFVVSSNLASAYVNPDISSRRITSLPYGCDLYGKSTGDFLKISSERYGDLYIALNQLVRRNGLSRDKLNSSVINTEAEKFLGAPYLWGGRSFFGIDCSGFVQTIMKTFDLDLPRDTKDQIREGREVRRENIEPGDLLFFPRHVALAISNDLIIHSSTANGGVSYNSLDPGDPLYSKHLHESFITARRILN